MFIPQWPHNLKSCETILTVATLLLRLFITCKPEGSCNFKALPGVIVIWFERDERLLRAEGGRDDDRLSVAKHKKHFKPYKRKTIRHGFITKNLERRRCCGGRDSVSGWLTEGGQPTLLLTVNTFWKERWGAQHHRHGNQSSQRVGAEVQAKAAMLHLRAGKLWSQPGSASINYGGVLNHKWHNSGVSNALPQTTFSPRNTNWNQKMSIH